MRSGPVPSPCISVCRIDPASGLCEGCLRSLDEIAAWSTLGDDARRTIWSSIEARRSAREAGDEPVAASRDAGR